MCAGDLSSDPCALDASTILTEVLPQSAMEMPLLGSFNQAFFPFLYTYFKSDYKILLTNAQLFIFPM